MVSLIIVDYKSINRTIEYINHFITMIRTNKEINIIIVDNNEEKDPVEYFENLELEYTDINYDINKLGKSTLVYTYNYRKHNLVVVKSGANLGYARGNNLGAKISKVLFDDDYYIFSNNDLRIAKEVELDDLLEPFKKYDDIAIIGPKIVGRDGKPQSPRKHNGIWKQLILYFPNIILSNKLYAFINNIDYDDTSRYTYWVMGCFLVADSKKFNEVDGFDEKTFLYAEEMILSERLMKKNYKNFFLNYIILIHEHGQTAKNTFSTIKGIKISFDSNYYYFKNYMNTNFVNLMVARLSFLLFKPLFFIKENIKKFVRKNI